MRAAAITAILAAAAGAAILFSCSPRSADPEQVTSSPVSPEEMERAGEYWTKERMEDAEPPSMALPEEEEEPLLSCICG
ncbi:hypothetical protein J0910_24550 [Nocardiopsis sp. CNT-189]|uniref:hypothetical protein n=1 Tax=Nocardiopsis oceanisediminis TaxID=2816862 RepID=UPI003B2E0286